MAEGREGSRHLDGEYGVRVLYAWKSITNQINKNI